MIVSSLKSGAVLVALGQPEVFLVGERAVVGERLVEDAGPVLVVGADRVGVPQLEVDPPALAAADPHQAQRPVPGDGLELGGGGPGQHGGGARREGAGLEEIAAGQCVRRRVVRHPCLLVSRPARAGAFAAKEALALVVKEVYVPSPFLNNHGVSRRFLLLVAPGGVRGPVRAHGRVLRQLAPGGPDQRGRRRGRR